MNKIIVSVTKITLQESIYSIEIIQKVIDTKLLEDNNSFIVKVYQYLKQKIKNQINLKVGGHEIFSANGFELVVFVNKENKDKILNELNSINEIFDIEISSNSKDIRTIFEITKV